MHYGHIHELTFILEAVTSCDVGMCYAFSELHASHNEIYVLEKFFIFLDLAQRRVLSVNYTINSHKYTMGYFRNDDISTVGNTCETISCT